MNTVTTVAPPSDSAERHVNEPLLFALARIRARGVPQWQVASLAGVGPSLLSFWVHGHRSPRPDEARRVAEVLGLPVEELWPGLTQNDVSPAGNRADEKGGLRDGEVVSGT